MAHDNTVISLYHYSIQSMAATSYPDSKIARYVRQIFNENVVNDKGDIYALKEAARILESIMESDELTRYKAAERLFNAKDHIVMQPSDLRRIFIIEAVRRLDPAFLYKQYKPIEWDQIENIAEGKP